MTDTSHDDDREMQTQLDEAARRWQPRHVGWESLLDRLPEQQRPDRPPAAWPLGRERRGAWLWLAVAASILAVLGLVIMSGPGLAQTLPIQVVRRGMHVTIFNAAKNSQPTLFSPQRQWARGTPAAAGMMLVKDQRLVLHLRAGDNTVRFTDVAASIDPTSVRLVSDTDPLGTRVVEQNFEFDLATADGILQRSLERKIACVGQTHGELTEGYLLSFDADQLVLGDRLPKDAPAAPRPQTQTIARKQLCAIRVARMPRDLHTRPTLVWKLRTGKPGDHHTTLTYLCGNAVWRADYVLSLRDLDGLESKLDFKGWVTVDNRSGTTYENAGLKLIAGGVNRVRDPWAPQFRQIGLASSYFLGKQVWEGGEVFRKQPEFVQRDFFEYKLYALNEPSTIKDRQIKQLQLLKASEVTARRLLICRSLNGQVLHPEVRLQIENKESNNLGQPLPEGTVTLMAQDQDGESQYLTRVNIKHTAKNEKININAGAAIDVVYAFGVVQTLRPADNHMIATYEFRVRSHKTTRADVRLVGRLAQHDSTSVLEASDPYQRYDHRTLHFDFKLEPNTEKRVTYKVDYRW